MTWFERVCVAWSMAAVAFSFGCAVRGEVSSQTETVFHFVCVGFHVVIIAAYIGMYLRRLTTHACRR